MTTSKYFPLSINTPKITFPLKFSQDEKLVRGFGLRKNLFLLFRLKHLLATINLVSIASIMPVAQHKVHISGKALALDNEQQRIPNFR